MIRVKRIRNLLPAAIAGAAALVLGGLAAAPAAAAAVPTASPIVAGSTTVVHPDLLPIPLQQGDSGSAVRLWQQDLNAFINFPPPSCRPTLAVDGSFGPLTTAATKCFQSAVGISRDGIVGSQTRGAMCTFLSAAGFTSLWRSTCR